MRLFLSKKELALKKKKNSNYSNRPRFGSWSLSDSDPSF